MNLNAYLRRIGVQERVRPDLTSLRLLHRAHLTAIRCRFLQTSDTSPFVQNLVCQRHTNDGLVILRGRVLRMLTPDGSSDRTLSSANELVAVLADVFDLAVPEVATLWPKICVRHDEFLAAQSAANRSPV
jgi:N-hydroxyarylamine O-acetyltransferase